MMFINLHLNKTPENKKKKHLHSKNNSYVILYVALIRITKLITLDLKELRILLN